MPAGYEPGPIQKEVVMAAKAEREESTTKVRRSRRELLAGAAGALGVIAAEAIGRATPARAADGDPVILGQNNSASGQTYITSSLSGFGVGSAGSPAIIGQTTLNVGPGVQGFGPAVGVAGQATAAGGTGVQGVGASDGIGVDATGDIGVHGDAPNATPNRIGVLGTADAVSAGTGVLGKSADGSGVVGKSATGAGVYGGLGGLFGWVGEWRCGRRLHHQGRGGRTHLGTNARGGGVHPHRGWARRDLQRRQGSAPADAKHI
jgi:hypothetical protein